LTFLDRADPRLKHNIQFEEPDYDIDIIDPVLKDFFQKMLAKNPEDRIGIDEVSLNFSICD
jgi:serine/threonine protein kinase